MPLSDPLFTCQPSLHGKVGATPNAKPPPFTGHRDLPLGPGTEDPFSSLGPLSFVPVPGRKKQGSGRLPPEQATSPAKLVSP